jgi:hypothetical protein
MVVPMVRFVLSLFAIALCLAGCGTEARYQPVVPESLTLKDSHGGYYSSKKADDVREMAGTQFQTENHWSFAKQGSGYRAMRTLDTMIARGYHKNSMPNELERKIDITVELDADLLPVAVRGYDTLHSVLAKIPQVKPEWKTQLLRMADTVAMAKTQLDLWRLFKIIPRDEVLVPGQALDVAALNQRLETLKADSAKFLGRTPRLRKMCFDAEVFYGRTDSLVLLREQFLNSTAANRKIRNASPGIATIKGTYLVSMNEKTGLPCYWSQTEIGDLVLRDSVGQEDIKIQLIRFEEDVVQ